MPMWGGPGRKELVEACMLCEHRETQERKVLERKVGACVQTQEDWGRRVQGVGCVCVCASKPRGKERCGTCKRRNPGGGNFTQMNCHLPCRLPH